MEEMSGLMRTTSRSESENHFFGQVYNSKATLVKFMTHYETAIEAQRHTHRKNDHESRYKRPQLKSNYQLLEGQAIDIYTKSIFCDVQAELIEIADCINQRYEDQPDGQTFSACHYRDIVFGVFQAFEQFGLLCRHIFYVLRIMDIKEFPKQYILNRWRKDASLNCSPEYSISREDITELDPDVQKELSLYKDHVQSYMKKVQDMQIVAPPASTRDRFAEITGQYKTTRIR
ncbi:protein FAR1-RELATED SEQUENCE 5-like [Helianthus annuus]|uniref:protein FAR1-RELATED SEQUENCE 5-like n=1 Tax=Helianthus annuus TaxID=4232 RepID=UPI000B8F0FF4|nr:protein FAR1-RELATED SEQUENCE 5-like [Helianthus annuus]